MKRTYKSSSNTNGSVHPTSDELESQDDPLAPYLWSRMGTDNAAADRPTAVIYVRVSTDQQERDGTSLDTQTDYCVAQVENDGLSTKALYVCPEQWTGGDLDRPVLNRVRLAMRRGLIRYFYVYTPDRLSRDPLHMITLMDEASAAGVQIRFVRGDLPDTAEGRLMAYITGYAAQRERAEITERTYRGKRRIARDEQRLPNGTGHGLTGYDYDRVNRKRTINEKEAYAIQFMFQLAFDGWTCYRIALELNELSIPTKTGKKWHPLGAKRILTNPAYTGTHNFGMQRHRKVSQNEIEISDQPESEWVLIEGFTPPLVTRERFDAVQKRLAAPQARAKNGVRKYLLTGFGKCASCRTGIVGANLADGKKRYRCRGTAKTSTRAAICHERYIPGEPIEELVWKVVVDTIRDPSNLIADLQHHLSTGDGDLGARMTALTREIADLKSQQSRLLELRQLDLIDLDLLQAQLGPLKALCDEKEATLRLLKEQRRQNDDAADVAARVAEYCQLLSEQLDNLDLEGKRGTMAAFGVEFEATRDVLSISIRIDPKSTTIARTWA